MGHRPPAGAIDARAMFVKVRETLAPRRRRARREKRCGCDGWIETTVCRAKKSARAAMWMID